MAKDMTTYPVQKDGKFLGYADARQIARNPALSLYDESKAKTIQQEAEINAAHEAEIAAKAEVAKVAKAGGANAGAVRKGPASK